ncbi:MAG: valine--tRNA ligase [Candidatus Thermoplasmatota archaeon]|nr:valine--tRNA ligase [Candidatus Thermoplasmatota archaeon]
MSSYSHTEEEPKWQEKWKEWKIYRFDPESNLPAYSIDNPPRYTSGSLHLGHATSYPMIDFAARYRRMRGYNVFFPLCFDTNGMPVETATEKKYGINKFTVDRKTYLRLCSEYANQFIETMTKQFDMLGMSLDSSLYYQTDSAEYRRITQITFLRMLKKGLAYRGTFPVNWCPNCNTSLADAEVEREERNSRLHYIDFNVSGGGKITIATTRPELIGACQAVLFRTGDSRYSGMEGKEVILPLYLRKVPVMSDPGVDSAFGSGAVMVCSYGDRDDVEWILKHKLPSTVIIDEFGRMNASALFLSGMNTEDARREIVQRLREEGAIVREEELVHSVGVCWRCATPVEILEKRQWFLRSVEFSRQILEKADEIRWFPSFMKQRLADWTESLNWDWVISRQRLFATPIPVWECASCDYVLAASEEQCYIDPQDTPPPSRCPQCSSELRGSTDVFDTWMDSSISVLYNTGWQRDERMFSRLFPMSLRAQAHEIIRTWTYYTVLRCHLLLDSIPWKDIMITGFIMAPDRTPMHTHLGNVIDPLPLIHKYGADALRYYAATCSLGTDQAFREKDVVHGQRLCNKLWNIVLFCSSFQTDRDYRPAMLGSVDSWIILLYNEMVKSATAFMDVYEFDRAMRVVEQFTWHDFADNYIEMVKQRAKKGDRDAIWALHRISLGVVKLLAPFLPHVTESVYQRFFKGSAEQCRSVHVSAWPLPEEVAVSSPESGRTTVSVIGAVRDWRAKRDFRGNIAELIIPGGADRLSNAVSEISCACRAEKVKFTSAGGYRRLVSSITPNYQVIGPRYRERAREIIEALKSITPGSLEDTEGLSVETSHGKVTLGQDEFSVNYSYAVDGSEVDAVEADGLLVLIRRG